MEIEKKINQILNNANVTKSEKLKTLGEISDYIEYGDIKKDEVIKDLNLLIIFLVTQTDDEIKEEVLDIILRGENCQGVDKEIDLSPIISNLSTFNEQSISYILSLLGYSGKKEYKTYIEQFKDNASLKEDVEDALYELNYRMSQQ